MSRAEKFIQEQTKRCSEGIRPFEEWLTPDQAREVAEIAKEETTKKALDWIYYNNRNGGCNFDGWEEKYEDLCSTKHSSHQ